MTTTTHTLIGPVTVLDLPKGAKITGADGSSGWIVLTVKGNPKADTERREIHATATQDTPKDAKPACTVTVATRKGEPMHYDVWEAGSAKADAE